MTMSPYTEREVKMRSQYPTDLKLLGLFNHAQLAVDYIDLNRPAYETIQKRAQAAFMEPHMHPMPDDDANPWMLWSTESLVFFLTTWWEDSTVILRDSIDRFKGILNFTIWYLGCLSFHGAGLTKEYVIERSTAIFTQQIIILLEEMIVAKEKSMVVPDHSFFESLMPKLIALDFSAIVVNTAPHGYMW